LQFDIQYIGAYKLSPIQMDMFSLIFDIATK